MKHKKTLVAILICLVLIFCTIALVACDVNNDSNTNGDNSNVGDNNGADTPNPSPHVHSFGEWITVNEATCYQDGTQSRTCNNCDYKEYKSISANTHVLGEWQTETPATCTSSGLKVKACENCDYKEYGIIPTNGHALGDWQTETTATCTSNGLKVKSCDNCDYKEESIIFSNGHEYNKYVQCKDCEIGLIYEFNEQTDSYAVIGYNGDKAEVVIPEKYNNKNVTAVKELAFYYCTQIKSLTIPKSVTDIGLRILEGCTSLESLTLPFIGTTKEKPSTFGYLFIAHNTQISINHYVPANLKSVAITNAKNIVAGTFTDCSRLTDIVIHEGLTDIGESAFANCSNLKSVALPDSLTTIGNSAFNNCGVVSISIPLGVTSIGTSAFTKCFNLENLSVDENNSKYSSSGNCIIETESKTLIAGCNNSVIPADGSVTTIGEKAFSYCTFTSISIPKSITAFENEAFSYCDMLEAMHYAGSKDEWDAISKHAFWNITTGGTPWGPPSTLQFTIYCSI